MRVNAARTGQRLDELVVKRGGLRDDGLVFLAICANELRDSRRYLVTRRRQHMGYRARPGP